MSALIAGVEEIRALGPAVRPVALPTKEPDPGIGSVHHLAETPPEMAPDRRSVQHPAIAATETTG